MPQLTPKQEEAIRNTSRFKVLNWGRRSGKTTEFAYEALGTALTIDNGRVTYYAQTLGDARDIAWHIFIDVFGGAVVHTNSSLLEITLKNLKGGTSKVALKGWESVVNSNKGRGVENDLILADEVAFCRGFLYYWDTVLEPTLLTTKGRAVFGSTPNGFNDFYTLRQRADQLPGWWYSHATSYDNPFNDPEEIERIKLTKTDDVFAQEYMADFRKQEGLVYKEFDRNRHIYDGETPDGERLGGVDPAYAHAAAVLTVIKDNRGHYWLRDELYKANLTDVEIADYTAAKGYQIVYPDPAQPQLIEELRRRGVNCHEVVKGADSIEKGIARIRELFKQNRLHIHKSCINTIGELESYARDPDTGKPIKDGDDAMDALRYVILMAEASLNPVHAAVQNAMFARNKSERQVFDAI